MAEDKKISQLEERTALTGNEMIPFSDSGKNGKIKSSLLKGKDGAPGAPGAPGTPGTPGSPGAPGKDGKSAYDIAKENGYTGTEEEFNQAMTEVPKLVTSQEEQDQRIDKVEAVTSAIADNIELFKDSDELKVGAWADGELSPDSTSTYGTMDTSFKFYLIDHTKNDGEAVTPVGELKRNNLFRFTDGRFAPAVSITEEQRAQCDVPLYLDSAGENQYCAAGEFDAEAFYNEHGINTKLYKADGTEIEHILRPWETTSKDYSIVKGRRDTIYLLDSIKGKSGKKWKGTFKKGMTWDGIDVSKYPLAPTGISPCPACTIDNKTRSFFYLYEGEKNCKSSAGTNNLCTMFVNGRTYPRVNDMQQVNNMNYARANNKDNTKPYPFAEGGYHALNTYITTIEVENGTKYIHKTDRFASGISSNDACNSETTWKANGGVRYKLTSADETAWKYGAWSSQGDIYTNNTQARVNFNNLVNMEYPKEQCMESQIAYSYAQENGIAAGEEFVMYGYTYWYQNVPNTDENGMNARVYKKMAQTFNAFDVEGNEQSWDMEVILRMSLFDGVNMTGDFFVYWGGGYEQVGTCQYLQADSLVGNKVELFMQPDQTQWVRETAFTQNNLGKFTFDDVYPKVGEATNLGDSYALMRQPYAAWKVDKGGSLVTGECFYVWDNNYWGNVLNQRVRIAARFRAFASHGLSSARNMYANYAASDAYRHYGGSFQVLLTREESAAPLQAE